MWWVRGLEDLPAPFSVVSYLLHFFFVCDFGDIVAELEDRAEE